jgi:predicted Holliday junction resolvase-like endonuclease
MMWLYILVTILLILFILYYRNKLSNFQKQLEELQFAHRSQSVKHGKNWEHFVPFMKNFEEIANKDNFVFIGMPIDGIAFDEDAIKFIEIKTGKGQLSAKQRQVRDLIKEGKVKWVELKY